MAQLRIKEAIKAHGKTINEIAEQMGINRVTLNSHMTGNPSFAILVRIAEAIGCSVTELIDDADREQTVSCPNCGAKLKVTIGSE